jgi:hypothetical protein
MIQTIKVSAKINTKQRLLSKKMDCRCLRQLSIYPKEFRSVERLYTMRDWNLETTAVESKLTGNRLTP